MRHIFNVLACTSLLGAMSCAAPRATHNQGDAPPAAEASRPHDFVDVESSIRTEIERGRLPSVAVAVARNGQIVHEFAAGWADKEQRIASTTSTPYPLASASKPIVATALMLLYERGRLDINAPALRYAGDWASPGGAENTLNAYSLKQLLNHTSGLGTYARIDWRDQERPVRGLEESFRKYGFAAQPPGTVFEYSNLGYGLVGHIVAQQSGASLPQFLKTELFEPLGMRHTMMVESFLAPPSAARKYDAMGAPLVDTYNDTPGAGNIYASVHDLALFGAFHLADDPAGSAPVLSPQSKRLMRSFVEPGALYAYYNGSHYGLGWYFRTTPGGDAVVWHEGGMPGASVIIVLLPQQNVAAAVVINANDANVQAQAFANALIKVVEPDFQVLPFNATDGFGRFTNQPEFLGRWQGTVRIDGSELPWALSFEADSPVRAEFSGRSKGDWLPAQTTFPALVNGDLLVATFSATLPATDVAQTPGGYTLLRLLRRGDELTGTMIAYASPNRLEHLYPFAVRLRREKK